MAIKHTVFDTAFNSYTARSILGQGGSGVVYEAEDTSGVTVAVKLLRSDYITTNKLKRFKNEIFFCERNNHKNILTLIDSGFVAIDDVKCPFYVMPVYGSTLRNLMSDGIEPVRVIAIFSEILDGAEAAHLKGVWHRDLKPENILIDPATHTPVLADFGIAHFSEAELETLIETRPGDRLANFQYAAPEQRSKGRPTDQRTDIFALGLILNEMFTGHVPQGASYRRISDASPDHGYLDGIVDRMISQDPGARYPRIDDIKKDLIARGNEFVARQKVAALKNEVVPEYTVDDPLVRNPIEIEGLDINNSMLEFLLSHRPNPDWINGFKNMGNYTHIPGICEPRLFRFQGRIAEIRLDRHNNAQTIVDLFKGYVSSANSIYKNLRERQAREAEQREREALKARLAEAETREQLLKKLRL